MVRGVGPRRCHPLRSSRPGLSAGGHKPGRLSRLRLLHKVAPQPSQCQTRILNPHEHAGEQTGNPKLIVSGHPQLPRSILNAADLRIQQQLSSEVMSGTAQGDEELNQGPDPPGGMLEVHHHFLSGIATAIRGARGLGVWTLSETDPLPPMPIPLQGGGTVPQWNPACTRQPGAR